MRRLFYVWRSAEDRWCRGLSGSRHGTRNVRRARQTGTRGRLPAYFHGVPGTGGQAFRWRVAIAGVLAMRPEMMILDEPTAGLDPQGRDEILGQIERLNREHGLTILVVSHSMEDMARYVDRIMVMNDGVKMFDDTPKEVFRHYKELEAIGLAAPQITYVVQGLRERGIPIDDAITTVEEAREAILALYNKRREKQ